MNRPCLSGCWLRLLAAFIKMEAVLHFMHTRDSEVQLNTEQQPAGIKSTSHLEGAGTLLLGLNARLGETDTEQQLMEKAQEFLVANLDPLAVFLAVNESDVPSRFKLYSYSRLESANEQALTQFLNKILVSGIDSFSVGLFDSFPFLDRVSRNLIKTPAEHHVRVLMFILGMKEVPAEAAVAVLNFLEQSLRVRIENLRLRHAMQEQVANLAGLYKSVEGLGREIRNASELLQAICDEARRVMGAAASAVLMPADETRRTYVVKTQSGFDSETIPLSDALFTRAMEDFETSKRKAVVYSGRNKEKLLLVPLMQRNEPIGVLFLWCTNPEFHLSDDRLQIAEILAVWISISIENAVMFDRVSQSQREWENTFDSIADPIYIVDNDFNLRKMNRSLASYVSKNIKLPMERNCFRYLFHRNTVCPWCPVPKGVETGESVTVEAPIFAGGLWQIQSFPFTDKTGTRVGSINVMRDITILKRMQEQLIESEKLASAGKLISGVAHEVRNPLFGISTTVRALANELGNKQELRPYLDIVTNETARLNRLMEDLLNYARPVQIDKNPSDMTEIVREVIEHFNLVPAAQAQEVSISFFNSDNIPPINVDTGKIKQVLFNLFENGIQHSTGKAKIGVFLEYLALANPPEIHIVVKDNGKGISPENLTKIFDPFYTTRQRGTGLGLSIVRKVIHDHGGRISVESHQDLGTTFRISLPVMPKQE
jgi:two-component system, NtrC family, sensor kinase